MLFQWNHRKDLRGPQGTKNNPCPTPNPFLESFHTLDYGLWKVQPGAPEVIFKRCWSFQIIGVRPIMEEEMLLQDWWRFHRRLQTGGRRSNSPCLTCRQLNQGHPGAWGAPPRGTFLTGGTPTPANFPRGWASTAAECQWQAVNLADPAGRAEALRLASPASASLLASCPHHRLSTGASRGSCTEPGARGKLTPAGQQLPVTTCAATQRCPPHAGSRPVFLGFPGRALASDLQVLLKEIKGCVTACQSPAFLSGVVFHQMPPHFWASQVLYAFTCLPSGKYLLMERLIPLLYLFIFQGFCFVFQFRSRRVSHAFRISVCRLGHCIDVIAIFQLSLFTVESLPSADFVHYHHSFWRRLLIHLSLCESS